MRIISKFQDYYDAAQGEGQDRSLVFLREHHHFNECHATREAPASLMALANFAKPRAHKRIVLERRGPAKDTNVSATFGVILFAGKLHPFARVQFCHSRYGGVAGEQVVCYSRDELAATLAPFEFDIDKHDKKVSKELPWDQSANVTTAAFFALAGSEQLREMAMEHRLAVASWERNGDLVQENPTLASFQMFRHLHAWQAFQELAMFWGNLAAPDRVPVHVADKDRIVQHGFDKWSFRRPPTKA